MEITMRMNYEKLERASIQLELDPRAENAVEYCYVTGSDISLDLLQRDFFCTDFLHAMLLQRDEVLGFTAAIHGAYVSDYTHNK